MASGYLNRPEVMAAIHVRDPGFCWAVCNTAPGWKYTVSSILCCVFVVLLFVRLFFSVSFFVGKDDHHCHKALFILPNLYR